MFSIRKTLVSRGPYKRDITSIVLLLTDIVFVSVPFTHKIVYCSVFRCT